ncbi:tryptophanyl-tRNA synthetase [Clohesyomyces aquaticus]|uniref:Tryptophan--tRNA ligase, mitochondrial n=1 Tax=Clohesyomyces aquaticus TaxID=1231657 RepID=A0A1Y2A0Y7_9PLEO|nr:tryptophanyl-tRNA synthetase [Clohesyomyces aquaticus]
MPFLARLAPRCRAIATTPPAHPCLSNSVTCFNSSSALDIPPRVIFSGIQPTGVPHLGNYLGALRHWAKLQDEASPDEKLLYSIVDLHAITVKQDPAQLRQWRKEMLASLLAVGLDPKRSIIFCQSQVPQHAELMWILSCNASMGYLSRMTQWKSKLSLPQTASPFDSPKLSSPALKLGLFSYPVLQAADILLYRTTHVPVGEDQSQHLEFSREIASSFNHLFPPPPSPNPSVPILVPPETILSPAKRIMSLTQPTKKMSKSDEDPRSRILITDSQEEIYKKIKSALTDSIDGISYDPDTRPGVSNLIDIMYHMDEGVASSAEELAKDFKGLSMRALKEKVAETIEVHIRPVGERYEANLRGATGDLADIAEIGRVGAERRAEATMREVREAVGLSWG